MYENTTYIEKGWEFSYKKFSEIFCVPTQANFEPETEIL
jgi:hypothetical protein